MLRDMPHTGSGRFLFLLVVGGGLVIVGVVLWFAVALSEPVLLGGGTG